MCAYGKGFVHDGQELVLYVNHTMTLSLIYPQNKIEIVLHSYIKFMVVWCFFFFFIFTFIYKIKVSLHHFFFFFVCFVVYLALILFSIS